LRLAEDAPITFSLTGTGLGGGLLELKIKNNKKRLRLPEDAQITFSLTGTGRGGGPLELKIKIGIKK
jgi:hypothetical protein